MLCNPLNCLPPGFSVHGFSMQEHWSVLPCYPISWLIPEQIYRFSEIEMALGFGDRMYLFLVGYFYLICINLHRYLKFTVQFSSVTQSCPTLCEPTDCSMPGLPVHHQLLEFTQTHVHWVDDAIQPTHLLPSPSPLVLNLSQHQGLFKWVSSSHQVAKVLEFQLQHQSFQWTPRTDLL